MGERSAVIIKNEGFTTLILDARIGDTVHGARLGSARLGSGGAGALSLLVSRFARFSVSLVVVIDSEIGSLKVAL